MIRAARLAADILLPPGEKLKLRVNGDSMRPALRRGDWLTVAAVEAGELAPGDVIVVRRANDLVTHRLIERRAEAWITKGDASRSPDPPVGAEQVLGRVTGVERDGVSFDLQNQASRSQARRVAALSRWEGAAWQRVYQASGQLFGAGSLPSRALAAAVSQPLRIALRVIGNLKT